ncbi:MAG: M14 family zinc carboxypeptidase [Planctomycetota bacterium]
MRASLLLLSLLTGCMTFHPLDAAGGSGPERADAADAAAGPVEWRPEWWEIGRSVAGLPLRITRVGHGPRHVLWVGGIHGNETEGRIATEELPRALLATVGGVETATLVILENVNPDGTVRNTRGNAHGVDLNRNFPAANFKPSRLFGLQPLDQPEARALHDLIASERPDLVIVAHSWHDDHFINFDGPAEHLARRFSNLSGYRVQASDGIAPTPGSLGSWVGVQQGIPILTLEYHRGRDPWVAWQETRQAILSVVLSGA